MAEVSFADGTIVAATRDQVSCDLDGEAAILNLKTGIYFGLNEVGSKIWNLIQDPRSVADVRQAVMDEYDVGQEQCDADLRALLADLLEHGLIELKEQ